LRFGKEVASDGNAVSLDGNRIRVTNFLFLFFVTSVPFAVLLQGKPFDISPAAGPLATRKCGSNLIIMNIETTDVDVANVLEHEEKVANLAWDYCERLARGECVTYENYLSRTPLFKNAELTAEFLLLVNTHQLLLISDVADDNFNCSEWTTPSADDH
jgi:hypothetical protein